jgi:hypothetical protein
MTIHRFLCVLPYPIALLIVIGGGLLHGDRTGRWRNAHELEAAVQRLRRIPLEFGGWRGRDRVLDGRQLEIGEIAGYRWYDVENGQGRERFQVLVVCGRPGPIAVHTPDVCYEASGYTAVELPTVQEIRGSGESHAEVRSALFRKQNTASPEALRIAWAWSAGDPWRAPDNPRVVYAASRYLYKVYVLHQEWPDAEDGGSAVMVEFLRELLPVLNRALTRNDVPRGDDSPIPGGDAVSERSERDPEAAERARTPGSSRAAHVRSPFHRSRPRPFGNQGTDGVETVPSRSATRMGRERHTLREFVGHARVCLSS